MAPTLPSLSLLVGLLAFTLYFPWVAFVLFLSLLALLFLIWLLAPFWYFKKAHGWLGRPPPAIGQDQHDRNVLRVQKQVRAATGAPLCTVDRKWHESVTTRALDYKKSCKGVRLDLGDVVLVDEAAGFVRVEPRCSQTHLVRHLLGRGLTLPMIVETEKITVGGLIMGAGIETTSHRVGLFRDICLRYELLLADGSVVTCSRDERPDLFEAVPFSYGCLCFLVSVDIQVIPAKRFVHLKYQPVDSHAAAAAGIDAMARAAEPAEFVEGLVYSRTEAVLISGAMCDAAPPPPTTSRSSSSGGSTSSTSNCRIYRDWFWSPFWHAHVRDAVFRRGVTEELMPLENYYFRHDRGLFWVMEQATPAVDLWWVRLLFGWALNGRLFHFLPEAQNPLPKRESLKTVVQDVTVPMRVAEAGIDRMVELFEIYPLWLCPLKATKATKRTEKTSGRSKDKDKDAGGADGDRVVRFAADDMYLDIGVYGVPRTEAYKADPVAAHREMEAFVLKTGGFLFSYAVCFFTEDELWRVYDRTAWDRAVERFGADGAFPTLYQKLCE